MLFLPDWFILASGVIGPAIVMKLVLDLGDWDFRDSDIALVECEEEGIDYSRAPEWYGLRGSVFFVTGMLIVVVIGYGIVGGG